MKSVLPQSHLVPCVSQSKIELLLIRDTKVCAGRIVYRLDRPVLELYVAQQLVYVGQVAFFFGDLHGQYVSQSPMPGIVRTQSCLVRSAIG